MQTNLMKTEYFDLLNQDLWRVVFILCSRQDVFRKVDESLF